MFSKSAVNTVDFHYLEYPLSRIFTMSNFLFGPLSILSNFPYKFVQYLELSLCRTIFLVPSVNFGLFSIFRTFESGFRMNHTVHFRHTNVNNCIDITLFGSLFFLFFNIAQATTCPQLSENSM